MIVSSLVPPGHRHLRMLRLFFPGSTESGSLRWASLVPDPEELRADADWYELVSSAQYSGLLSEPAAAPEGRLGADTAEVLVSALNMTGYDGFA